MLAELMGKAELGTGFALIVIYTVMLMWSDIASMAPAIQLAW